MAENSLYPGFTKLYYENASLEHVMTIPMKPFVGAGGAWYVELSGDVLGGVWTTVLTTYVNLLKVFFANTTTFTYAELWTMASADADPVFVSTAQLNIAGTAGSAQVNASQVVLSCRTFLGGTAKVYMLDTALAANQKLRPPSYGSAGTLALVNYLTGVSCPVFGRDGSRIVAVPQGLTKTNDSLRRRYNLT